MTGAEVAATLADPRPCVHEGVHRDCGFGGCVNLRPWAEAHRYRWHFEESYTAERDTHVKGDGRWYVEVVTRHGIIYPRGGDVLVAWTNNYRERVALDEVAAKWRTEGPDNPKVIWSREYRFRPDQLDAVAAILRPKRLGGRLLTPEERERNAARLAEGRKAQSKCRPPGPGRDEAPSDGESGEPPLTGPAAA